MERSRKRKKKFSEPDLPQAPDPKARMEAFIADLHSPFLYHIPPELCQIPLAILTDTAQARHCLSKVATMED